jgi:hypothetical protein
MRDFFYKNWILYYILFFLLLGLLIYAILWTPNLTRYNNSISDLNNKLKQCNEDRVSIDTVGTYINPVKVDNSVNCDNNVKSGGQGVTTTHHELGNRSGYVAIEYDMLTVPDQIKVIYDNVLVYSSNGLVGGSNEIGWSYAAKSGKPTFCIVEISAPNEGTSWRYLLKCPQ